MNRRRLLVAVGASALMLLGSLPLPALAAGPDRAPQRIDLSKFDPTFRPGSFDPNREVTVVLELSGRPAIRFATTRAGQQAQAAKLRSAQRSIAAAVARKGAKVIARYQHAYNGLRVRTTLGRLEALSAIAGVVGVHPLRVYTHANVNGVPAIGAPTAWEQAGATGAGTIVAVIDTGIDYTHANFGGAGTEVAYTGNDSDTIEAGTFPTTKVIAGHDFAGDNYDANGEEGPAIPTPDDDPLDCNGHGSHVSGTVAGRGVLADHSSFDGIYDASTIGDADWIVGPGVAPEAKLVGLKVFGCEGSTDLVVDALDWVAEYNSLHAVGIDVVNMSLGSPFGKGTDPDAVATNNLVASGVVVVASAGNEAAVPYITGAPAAATRAISVAALDANPTLPMATIEMTGDDIAGINQNAHPGLPVAGNLHVLDAGGGDVKLGCLAGDYDVATAGTIVAVKRGECAFVEKGELAEAAGAIGIVVINTDAAAAGALPTFIGYNPEIFDIPMIGTANTVTGGATTKSVLLAAEGQAITLSSAGTQANPALNAITSFSSSGPRWGDSWLKPDVAAPGAGVVSTLVGGGWTGTTLSGTSMASPMTAGAAALVVQAHPGWSPLKVKAALVNTADADSVVAYDPERAGSGLVAVDLAADANVVATTSDGTASLSYGYVRANGAWSASKTITFWNDGPQAAAYSLAASSSLVRLSSSTIIVPAGGSRSITATARLSATRVRNLPSADQFLTGDFSHLPSMDGAITASPAGLIAGQHALRIPYLVVPRGVSNVTAERGRTWTSASGIRSGRILLENSARHAGWADVYALGTTDAAGDGANGTDVRATGVSVLPASVLTGTADPGDRTLTFAVTMHDRFSSAAPHVLEVLVDTDLDGDFEFDVIGIDRGLITSGAYDGTFVSTVYDLDADAFVDDITWSADAPLNGSTVLLPALASQLGLSAGDGAFAYFVAASDGFTAGAVDLTRSSRAFDAFNPSISTGQFRKVDARSTARVPAWFRRSAAPRGWLVITLDDRNGAAQGAIVRPPR